MGLTGTATILLTFTLATQGVEPNPGATPTELYISPTQKMTYFVTHPPEEWGVCLRVIPRRDGESFLEFGRAAQKKTPDDTPSENAEKRCVIFSERYLIWPKVPRSLSVKIEEPLTKKAEPRLKNQTKPGPDSGWIWLSTQTRQLSISLKAKN